MSTVAAESQRACLVACTKDANCWAAMYKMGTCDKYAGPLWKADLVPDAAALLLNLTAF